MCIRDRDYWIADKLRRLDRRPDPLTDQQGPPPPVDGGTHAVQLLRTYPNLRQARDYPFAPGGERSVARGYEKAAKRARRLVYVEDQYFWGQEIASTFLDSLVENRDLHLVCVLPLHPDLEGSSRTPQLLGRQRAIRDLMEAAPGRVAAYVTTMSSGFQQSAITVRHSSPPAPSRTSSRPRCSAAMRSRRACAYGPVSPTARSTTAAVSSESWVHDRRLKLSEPVVAQTSSITHTLACT